MGGGVAEMTSSSRRNEEGNECAKSAETKTVLSRRDCGDEIENFHSIEHSLHFFNFIFSSLLLRMRMLTVGICMRATSLCGVRAKHSEISRRLAIDSREATKVSPIFYWLSYLEAYSNFALCSVFISPFDLLRFKRSAFGGIRAEASSRSEAYSFYVLWASSIRRFNIHNSLDSSIVYFAIRDAKEISSQPTIASKLDASDGIEFMELKLIDGENLTIGKRIRRSFPVMAAAACRPEEIGENTSDAFYSVYVILVGLIIISDAGTAFGAVQSHYLRSWIDPSTQL